MQVFIIGSSYETAMCLDKKRLNKQIVECKQMLRTLDGLSKAWKNHPCTIQYNKHRYWLWVYMLCLASYRDEQYLDSILFSEVCEMYKPEFHTDEYFEQMKRRLYTKDKEHYSYWSELGESNENWYWVDNQWKKYVNGKIVK